MYEITRSKKHISINFLKLSREFIFKIRVFRLRALSTSKSLFQGMLELVSAVLREITAKEISIIRDDSTFSIGVCEGAIAGHLLSFLARRYLRPSAKGENGMRSK